MILSGIGRAVHNEINLDIIGRIVQIKSVARFVFTTVSTDDDVCILTSHCNRQQFYPITFSALFLASCESSHIV